MKWRACECATCWYDRLGRAWWMRMFFPERRLYRCMSCQRLIFVARDDVRGWRGA